MRNKMLVTKYTKSVLSFPCVLSCVARLMKISAALFFVALAGCGRDAVQETAAAKTPERTDGTIVLGVMAELPPYAYVDTNSGEICGIDIDIIKAVAARLGRPLKIKRMLFNDLLPAVKDHTIDFAAGEITITEGRRSNVEFSIPYAEEGAAFLYHVGGTVPTMVRAESMRVGAVESMTHDFYLTRHGIDPFRYKSIDDALKDLMAHKIDTIFYDRPAIAEVARSSGGKLAVTPLETREHYGIAVRKDRTDYLEAVNAVIRERKGK